jgi:hypothetical protein
MSAPDLSCPFCNSADVELVSAWGGQLITSQMRCRACNTHFEAVRDDFESRDGNQDRQGPGLSLL